MLPGPDLGLEDGVEGRQSKQQEEDMVDMYLMGRLWRLDELNVHP